MTLIVGYRSVRLERCPVTESQHGINQAFAVSRMASLAAT